MKELLISDVTLRQQQRRQDAAQSFKERIEIAKLLDKLRPDAIELFPITNERADTLLVKSIAGAVQHSRLAIPAKLSPEGVQEAWQAVSGAKYPRLQIAVPTSTVQMEYACHLKPAAMLELIANLVAKAKALCPDVEFIAEDATRSEREFLHKAVDTAIKAGAASITLCDTAGILLPEETGDFIAGITAAVPGLQGVVLGIECVNTLSLAPACVVAAAKAGVGRVKTAAIGGGAAALGELAEIFRVRGADLGMSLGVRTTELTRISNQVDWIVNTRRSATSPFDSGVKEEARSIPSGWALDSGSSAAEVASAVKKLGYDLSEEDGAKVYEAFAQIARKKTVGEKELDAIIASAAMQVPPTYVLESYVINSGNVISATANIRLNKNGAVMQGIALGDGPVDAAFLAIEQIVGHHYELDDFQIQAVTEGREAMGSSLVRLRSNGRLYSGNGISTDIIGASIRAYLNALNKIVFEEAHV